MAIPANAGAQQPPAAALVFDGVTVIDVEQGKLLPAQRVVIAGNRIQAVGDVSAVKAPKEAQVVDARGKYLIPGLWDMHVHSTRMERLSYPVINLLLLAHGVTGFRDPGAEGPLDTMIKWRRETLAGTRVGPPRQVLSAAAVDEEAHFEEATYGLVPCPMLEGGWAGSRSSGHTCVPTGDSAAARRLVGALKAAGIDMLKTYILSQEMYFVVAAEARRLGLPFGGHTQIVSPLDASDSGASIVDHFGGDAGYLNRRCRSAESCREVAERFRRNGTWWAPTLTMSTEASGSMPPRTIRLVERYHQLADTFWSDSTPSRYSPAGLTGVPLGRDAIRELGEDSMADSIGRLYFAQRAGVPMLAATDLKRLPGLELHVELAVLVTEGMTPLGALQAATLNPAKVLRATDSLGTVAAGKLADLVLLDADPLADITNTTMIHAVVANGRYYDRAALDRLLAQAKAEVRAEAQGKAQEQP